MVETNTNDSFLTPVDGDLGDSLVDQDEPHKGFDPNFIPESIEPENQNSASVGAIADGSSDSSSDSAETATSGADTESGGNSDSADSQETKNKQNKKDKKSKETTNTSEGGVRGTQGVNGSTMHLPFNLDYTKVPVLGSYSEEQDSTSEVTTLSLIHI